MKKTTKVISVALVVIALGAAIVSAAPGFGPGFGPMGAGGPGQAVALTDAQKQELVPIYNQMFELRKQMMQKYVGFGTLTQEQANWRIGAMKERQEAMIKSGNFGGGPGFGPGGCRGGGPGGRGPGNGPRGQNPPQ